MLGMILMPYFLSKPLTAAITTLAQSVNGMKPILISVFSGASEPAAQAALFTPGGTRLMSAAAAERVAVFFMKSRLLSLMRGEALGPSSSIAKLQKKTASIPAGKDAVVQGASDEERWLARFCASQLILSNGRANWFYFS